MSLNMESLEIPPTHKALVLQSTRDPVDMAVHERETPQPGPGAALIRILASPIVAYAREVYNGKRKYAFPPSFVPGSSAIGRVAKTGPDATLLRAGQLVFVDCVVRGRDDPLAQFLSGLHEGHTPGSRALMHGEWRDSTHAEFYKAPLENCYPLNEKILLGSSAEGGLGYKLENLAYMAAMLVPFGGLRDVNLQVGETLIVAPATGTFGGAAVQLGLALGARVVAVGRNPEVLARVEAYGGGPGGRVRTVPITGDIKADAAAMRQDGPADVFIDISPPTASHSTHVKSAILSLGYGGRISLMGGQREDVPIPFRVLEHSGLQIKGKWMYEREDVRAFIRLVEAGIVKLGQAGGVQTVGKFSLEQYEAALDAAADNGGFGRLTLFTP